MAKLVVGCGYLGSRVAQRWLSAGQTVYAVTRSAEHAEELRGQGVQPIVADVTRPETLQGLPEVEAAFFAVGYDPRSGLSRQAVYVDGLRNVLNRLSDRAARVIFTSSTGVYGQAEGDWVDEDSPCRPTREAGLALLAAEELLRGHRFGQRSLVLRLAGIYGPGRIAKLADVLAGRPIVTQADGYVNLIHVDDAAEAVLAAETRAQSPRVYLISDGHPTKRKEFYTHLATLLGREAPAFLAPPPETRRALRSATDKRVSNRRMREELRVKLRYPSYREGLAAVVKGEGAWGVGRGE
ncbi:MAG: SDR family oxidoreductase [Thermoguttaceae bacterium]